MNKINVALSHYCCRTTLQCQCHETVTMTEFFSLCGMAWNSQGCGISWSFAISSDVDLPHSDINTWHTSTSHIHAPPTVSVYRYMYCGVLTARSDSEVLWRLNRKNSFIHVV